MRRILAVVAGAVLLCVSMKAEAAVFSDVPESHSLALEIEYLAGAGVISGYTDGTFKPNAPIAKKHIAKMLTHALLLPTTDLKPLPYKDVPMTHPYYKEIAAVYTAGIFSDAENFRPELSISRAFMAKIISTSFELKSIAQNAMTYVDVPTTSEFYRPIQLVTMNNIAQGYELTNGYGPTTFAFAPSNLLTRAHFSAFLARAMSLSAGDYTPDTRYTYTFEHADGLITRMEFDETQQIEGGIGTFWNMYEENRDGYERWYMYFTRADIWSYAEPEISNFYVTYPFTVGYKRGNSLDYMYYNHRRDILETKATYRIGDITFYDVVVVRDRYWDEALVTMTEETTYIAKHYGVVAKEVNGEFVTWLVRRELKN